MLKRKDSEIERLTNQADGLLEGDKVEEACEVYEKALEIGLDNVATLANFANALATKDEWKKSFNFFQLALEIAPDRHSIQKDYVIALTKYARSLSDRGKTSESLEYFERALEYAPTNDLLLSKYFNALEASGQTNRYFLERHANTIANSNHNREYQNYFNRVLALAPNNDQLKSCYAIVLESHASDLVNQDNACQALKLLDRAREIKPGGFTATQLSDYAFALLRCAKALDKGDRTAESLEVFQRALQIKPDDVATLGEYGNALIKSGRSEESLEVFERALEVRPQNLFILNSYANALVKSDRAGESLEVFERALGINPKNYFTLNSYANALVKSGRVGESLEVFERALDIKPKNVLALNSYATALLKSDRAEESLEVFKRALDIKPKNVLTLNSYANALVKNGRAEESLEVFKRALDIEPNDALTLNSYANALVKSDRAEESLEEFKRALKIEPNDDRTLSSYAVALVKSGHAEESLEEFKRALEVNPKNAFTLSSYASALVKSGHAEESLEEFKRALEIDPNDDRTLNSYANALVKSDRAEESLEVFEQALEIDPNDDRTLSSYAAALVKSGRAEESLEEFKRALEINPKNVFALSSYASTLVKSGHAEESLEVFERVLEIEPDNAYILFRLAETLQDLGRNLEAAAKLEDILHLDKPNADNFIVRLQLGRLYFLLGRSRDGQQQFDTAIKHSHNADGAKLRIARDFMTVSPYHEYANDLLREIAVASPRYGEAQQALGLNLDSGSYFETFSQNATGRLQDQAALNRALYHKINNRIAILKELLYEKLSNHEDPMLRDLNDKFVEILEGIKERRARADRDSQTGKLGDLDYTATLKIIAETAHNIVDFVGNKINSVREQLWETCHSLRLDTDRRALYEDIQEHVARASRALDDLKRINEGIRLQFTRLSIKELFDPWQHTPTLRDGHARIQVDLDEPNSIVTVDVRKVRGFLDELVENSLKHNTGRVEQGELVIEFFVSITPGLPLGRDRKLITISGLKYLNIKIKDNGWGVALDQKEWIFQPLATTAQHGEGTGLGLFDIRRTIEKMHGFIWETGTHGAGACFELYIPLENIHDNRFADFDS